MAFSAAMVAMLMAFACASQEPDTGAADQLLVVLDTIASGAKRRPFLLQGFVAHGATSEQRHDDDSGAVFTSLAKRGWVPPPEDCQPTKCLYPRGDWTIALSPPRASGDSVMVDASLVGGDVGGLPSFSEVTVVLERQRDARWRVRRIIPGLTT
jgi:hypothetical protein